MKKQTLKSKKIPKSLQAVLWSVDVKRLDLQKDKGYYPSNIRLRQDGRYSMGFEHLFKERDNRGIY